MTDITGDAAAIISAVERLHGVGTVLLPDDIGVFAVPNGITLKSVKPFADEWREFPDRRKGTAYVQDLASLVELTNRFKDTDSALFCDRLAAKPTLTAVIDYSEAGAAVDVQARHQQHRIVYPFPLSEEWLAWLKHDGEVMGQGEFAEFLEDRIGDVSPPPTSTDLTDDRFPGLATLAGELNAMWAGPSRLIELSRGLAIHVEHKVEQAITLQSGEAKLVFTEEHRDATGEPIKVPSMFLIVIPVFDSGAAYRIAARLRYRKAGSALKWSYSLWRPDLAIRHAITQAAQKAHEETGLPIIYGIPEA